MKEIKIHRPIQKSANVAKLTNSDLTNTHSNIFDNFKTKNTNNFDNANRTVLDILKQIPSYAEFFEKSGKNYKNFEVVFPKGILKKIKSGEYLLNKKVGTDEFLAFVKDKKTNNIVKQLRLKEITNSEKLNNLLPSLQNMAVMNSLNQLSSQLELIEKKLSDIHKEFNNDRIGKIQAGYSSYLDAIQMSDDNKREIALLSAHKSLNEGRSQLIESAKQRLSNIEVGFWKSLFKELKAWNYKKTQEENIKEFIKEVFYIQRSSQIILTIYQELNEPQSLIQSLAPFKDFMEHINDDTRVYKINEWETSENNWKQISSSSLKAIQNIPSYNEIENAEIKIEIDK
ncbi:hypothetical protein ACFPH8_05700 [Bizionia hallyeonensis]|uniref:Uncharacterized protein n=1 Tax=Bizionia hallyeonensis TaxID=1123757 RepID=A0ABW0C3M7_9FLAO